ncbi:AMPKBI-domain-containing protein [Meira miltonrushii]|uniref:AMPKBI-domain-containing protein n=1 Tax=Meira miltonrushii TaxID=1280837 RepID=A0A316VAS7_9BASI|nr:AMPKBI-domain-containing protein [Meira miltonrushii]PWN34739.1 AMPKBI-domain-containing protein [Meira miltonrushii]
MPLRIILSPPPVDIDDGLSSATLSPITASCKLSSGIASLSSPHRQSSQDSTSLLSPGGTDASHTSSSGASRLRSVSSPVDDGSTEGSSFSQVGPGYDSYNPMFPYRGGTAKNDSSATSSNSPSIRDPLGRKQPTALPSYLKIPTLIPSAYASPTSSEPSSPHPADRVTMEDDFGSSMEGQPPSASQQLTPAVTTQTNRHALGGSAAVAILNTEDVLLAPGEAGKVTSPLMDESDSSRDIELEKEGLTKEHTADSTSTSERSIAATISSTASDQSTDQRQNNSRTPTPTPGSMGSGRAMTPTEAKSGTLTSLSSSKSTEAARLAQAALAASNTDQMRRPSLQLYTGTESGAATPALPIGLTSAPSSALTPAIPTYGSDNTNESSPTTPLTKETNSLKLTLPETTPTAKEPVRGHPVTTPPKGEHRSQGHVTSPSHQRQSSVPLVPIVVKWRGGGKEVFVTGTFANEWRSKISLRKSPTSTGKRPEYSCVLHLAPGTHRLKFIVDDRWRVSRDLSTASDGEGNLTNYIEVAHTGPAHPGPLSAPGEDLLAPMEEDENKGKKQGLSAHKAAVDLLEEARRAEALQRGNLLDVFGEDKVRHEERWTQEIPPSIVKAQASEEAYRNELEAFQASSESKSSRHHNSRDAPAPPVDVPVPPTLPRQLEKVILNSTSAAVLGTVDDNSVLPAPNHAVLHHLTASAIKSGVIATGCTVRYRKKYITTVYYRAAS